MEENTFWLSFWTVLFVSITTMVGMSINHYTKQDAIIADMLINGIDPLTVSCVMHDSMGNNPTCVILAAKNSND